MRPCILEYTIMKHVRIFKVCFNKNSKYIYYFTFFNVDQLNHDIKPKNSGFSKRVNPFPKHMKNV